MKHIITKITLITAAIVALFLFTTNENFGDQGGGGTGWKVPGIAKKIKNPVPSNKLSLKLGKKLYTQNCVTCHGETGIGDGPGAKFLGKKVADLISKPIQSQADGVLYYKITKGRAPMPAFNSILSSKQRWAVVNYLRALKSK